MVWCANFSTLAACRQKSNTLRPNIYNETDRFVTTYIFSYIKKRVRLIQRLSLSVIGLCCRIFFASLEVGLLSEVVKESSVSIFRFDVASKGRRCHTYLLSSTNLPTFFLSFVYNLTFFQKNCAFANSLQRLYAIALSKLQSPYRRQKRGKKKMWTKHNQNKQYLHL